MNDEFDTIDAILIDRFVDGELNGDEERGLLRQLDEEPGGWRALALAFVESRVWRRELGDALLAPPEPSSSPEHVVSPAAAPVGEPVPPRRRSTLLNLVAAGLLIATGFGLDMLWRRSQVDEVAERDRGKPVPVSVENRVPRPEPVAEPVPESFTVLVSEGDRVRPVEVPLVREGAGMPRVNDPADRVFEELRRSIERTGHGLSERHTVYRVPLDAEHDVLLPVRDVELAPRAGIRVE